MDCSTILEWQVVVLCSIGAVMNLKSIAQLYIHLQSVCYMSQVHKTGYHFQTPGSWIYDPNGPMYYNGIYHLFYQYNPRGVVWGDIEWGHSVSRDLINWKRLPSAIYPSKPFDKYGCWSGSATILPGNKPIIMYTGVIDQNKTQVQNHAIPANLSDPYLKEWVKPDNNPLILADQTIDNTSFRDPTTAWLGLDGHWRISVGGKRGKIGISYLYKSKDFMRWVNANNPLHSRDGTGNWECVDFYPVSVSSRSGLDTSVTGPDVKHVLKASLDVTRYDYYTLGRYDLGKDVYIPDEDMVDGWNGLRYDYGNFYASKSFFDPIKNRRILWGWANESDSVADHVKKGWFSIQLIPRTIMLDPNRKQLLLWPIEEVETLRGKHVELSSEMLVKRKKIEIKGITAAQADVEVTFSFKSLDKAEPFDPKWDRYDAQKVCSQNGPMVRGGLGPFGLLTLASPNLEEYTPVFFRIFKDQNKHLVLMCSDASRSTLKDERGAYRPSSAGFVDVDLTGKKLSLRSLIDHSVVESFGAGGKICITSRVYPTRAIHDNAHLFAFNNGNVTIKIDSLNAWSMNNPDKMNRDTTSI